MTITPFRSVTASIGEAADVVLNLLKSSPNPSREQVMQALQDVSEDKVLRKIVDNIKERFPKWFTTMMTGPTDLYEGKVIAAQSVALSTEYTLEKAQDYVALGKKEELIADITKELGDELNAHFEKLEAEGKKVVPYVVLDTLNAVRPDSFSPIIGFKTRYGIVE